MTTWPKTVEEAVNQLVSSLSIVYQSSERVQSLAYLTPVDYIERELAKIHSPLLPMWSASTKP